MRRRVLVVAGPTGSGKSSLALALAQGLGGEVVGCDSVQVYRGFDIGSAKPTPAEQAAVPHHLVDVVDWRDDFDAARFAVLARAAVDDALARGRVPIVCGGTGLYLRALLEQEWHQDLPKDDALRAELQREATPELYARLQALDPQRAAALHPNDRFRVVRALELVTLLGRPLHELAPRGRDTDRAREAFVIVLDPPRAALHKAIEARSCAMLDQGLLAEVSALLAAGVDADCKPMRSIGYLQAAAHLRGELSADALLPAIVAATRQYAKRQCTWFRRVEADLRLEQWQSNDVLQACRAALGAASGH